MIHGRNQTSCVPQTDEWAETLVESKEGITLNKIQRALRGRIHLVIILGLICSVLGAAVGLTLGRPQYTSTALVHVAPVLPRVLFANEHNKPLPNFESFIEGQATLLLSRGTMDEALRNPVMRDVGWPSGARGEKLLLDATTVIRERSEEFITVSVTDLIPARAQAATNALIDAYIRPQREQADLKRQVTEQTLHEREQSLEQEATDLQERIVETASKFGGSDLLERIYAAKIRQLEHIESKLSSDSPMHMADRILIRLEQEETNLLLQINALDPNIGPNHPEAKQVSLRLHTVRRLIADRNTMLTEQSGWNAQLVSTNHDSSKQYHSTLNHSYDHEDNQPSLMAEVTTLGRARHLVLSLQEQLEAKNEQLAETRFRLEEFDVESVQIGGTRISIAARGHLPSVPSKDWSLTASSFGALFGAFFGTSVICLLGLFDRRCRFIADVEMLNAEIPLLGTIPDQEIGRQDTNERSQIAIHELRNTLEIARGTNDSHSYCITSPDVGDGKTSLTLALGASFALAGHRTLVIDTDLQHSGMTRVLGLDTSTGLSEFLNGEKLPECIHTTTTPGLSIMPAGHDDGFGPERLSGEPFNVLLKQALLTYDTVLVDTTPLLGGLEASLIAVLCDRVVLTLQRNQDSRLASDALRRLEQLGASCAGIVFNRALPSDHIRSGKNNTAHTDRSPIMLLGKAVTVSSNNPTVSRESKVSKSMERAA